MMLDILLPVNYTNNKDMPICFSFKKFLSVLSSYTSGCNEKETIAGWQTFKSKKLCGLWGLVIIFII